MSFHIREHHWNNGVLSTIERFIEDFDEALDHASDSLAHTIKIYNIDGELVHIKTPDATDTYA